jgi:sirohydrochlorin ferrochelatase
VTVVHENATAASSGHRTVAGMTLLAISHGTSSAEGANAVAALVDAVGRRLDGVAPVRGGFVDVQQPDVPTCLASLRSEPAGSVVVVPLLLSAGYHVHVDLREDVDAAVLAGDDVVLAGALGPDDRVVEVLAQRLAEAGLRDDDVLVLAAAGSSDARAVADCEVTAELLAARLGREVRLGFISAAQPPLPDAVAAARRDRPGARVMVASYLLAPGYFADLASTAGGDVTTAPLLVADGEPPAELVDVVVDRYLTASPAA